MNLAAEERHLRLVNDHLAKADLRIRRQEKRIQAMETAGLDTVTSLNLLTLMREAQQLMEQHREQILEAIERIHSNSPKLL